MYCLFCKSDSSTSKSVEHVIPESLGNKTSVLKPGIVCDKCNNYFAREVEKPFLEAPAIVALRFNQAIPSKKGKVPPLNGILEPGYPAVMYRPLEVPLDILSLEPEGLKHLSQRPNGKLLFPASVNPPEDIVVSRFLAKAGLEAMAERLQQFPAGLQYLTFETQLDPIRRHAREGFPKAWPYHVRRIYDENRHFTDENGKEVQTIHEHDLLQTATSEWYFVTAIFGLELAINMGGPEIEGYQLWLKAHNGVSPLYHGKNGP